ncbi:MAG: A/G-specific adenine glycosylase [Actinomycetota bacterium]|nr:A/G-specific adenine glycosylase [Actinomycetota bacterium]
MSEVAVLAWGVPRLRDLPWRRTRDPWAVLVSEVMLQQTQVARVVPKYLAFMEAFPTPAECAAAPLGDVLRSWQGLGYPRRARNLHAAATEVAARGTFPESLPDLLALPGVGQYTARAVLAFAFEADAAVVDTNIARVYARVAGRSLTAKEVQAAADLALPSGDGWAWNQCLMELGATLCRPGVPACDECPLQRECAWHGVGPDPAIGSSGVSRPQARFEGSERQARGRLMKALSNGAVRLTDAPDVMRHAAAPQLIDALCREGLVRLEGEWLLLP